MKNMQKVVLFSICMVLCAVILSCATTGGAKAEGPGTITLAKGDWMVYDDANDGGSSTSSITSSNQVIDGETVMVHHIKGNVTTKFRYGFAGWGLNQDEETLALYKTAKAFSFWIQGDGKRYTIKFKTSNVRDHAYFEYSFNTEAGVPMLIEVPMGFFMQPSWGQSVRKNQELVTGMEWQTHESWRTSPDNNPFEIKMWDFKVHN